MNNELLLAKAEREIERLKNRLKEKEQDLIYANNSCNTLYEELKERMNAEEWEDLQKKLPTINQFENKIKNMQDAIDFAKHRIEYLEGEKKSIQDDRDELFELNIKMERKLEEERRLLAIQMKFNGEIGGRILAMLNVIKEQQSKFDLLKAENDLLKKQLSVPQDKWEQKELYQKLQDNNGETH